MALGRLAPWFGIVVPPLVWFLAQQGLGDLVYVACQRGGPPIGPAVGVAAALICAGAGGAAWRGREEQPFLAKVGAGVAAIFVLASLALTAAALLVGPPCAR